jgi:DNA-binding transcriptional regulator YiaG
MRLLPMLNNSARAVSGWEGRGSNSQPFRISERVESPAQATRSAFLVRQGAAVLAFLVGTGGLSTADYILARSQRGYAFENIDYSRKSDHSENAGYRSPGQNLDRIRETLSPSVTDLAFMFNVSRQTIYNWLAGDPIAQGNEDRLERVASAADLLANHGLNAKQSVLRRKFREGKTFFELVRDGMEPDEIARMMILTVDREQKERGRLASRLENRPRKKIDLDDIGAPHMDEHS